MAEFCYECFKKTFGLNVPEQKVQMSKYVDLCEGCGEYKPVVLSLKKPFLEKVLDILQGKD